MAPGTEDLLGNTGSGGSGNGSREETGGAQSIDAIDGIGGDPGVGDAPPPGSDSDAEGGEENVGEGPRNNGAQTGAARKRSTNSVRSRSLLDVRIAGLRQDHRDSLSLVGGRISGSISCAKCCAWMDAPKLSTSLLALIAKRKVGRTIAA